MIRTGSVESRARRLTPLLEAGTLYLRSDARELIDELAAYTPPRSSRMDNLTAPRIALDLAERVELVEEFGLVDDGILRDWTVTTNRELGEGMVLRWDRTTVTVGERGDLELARFIVRQRTEARQDLARVVALARRDLGWGRGEPLVRCVVCRTSATASQQHAPGSRECADTREERRIAHSD